MDNLTLWLTPITIVSAVGLLILSTTTRYIDAINTAKSAYGDTKHPEYGEAQFLRAKHIRDALTMLYVSVAILALTIFGAGLFSLLNQQMVEGVLIGGTCLAVLLVAIAAIILLKETYSSLQILRDTIYQDKE